MVIRRTTVAMAALLATFSASGGYAWSAQGHYVTGVIAYDDLASADPAVVTRVEKIMASHPDRARFDRLLAGLTGAARTRRLFELMASWPDDVRGTAWDHPAWHYWLRLISSTRDPSGVPARYLSGTSGEAAEAYALALATVKDAYAPAPDRAVALCWMFHLGGDIQQPLHAGQIISKRFPLSDNAGMTAFVRRAFGAPVENLHGYWDSVVDGPGDDEANVDSIRRRLERAMPRRSLSELDGESDAGAFRRWADESLKLARSAAYADDAFEGGTSAANAELLSPTYLSTARRVGDRRIALGGYRLADALRYALAPAI